jgi:hypothetical protein
VQCATELLGADNTSLFFFNINCNYHLRAKLGNVDNAACRKSAARLIACPEGPASGWHRNTWLDPLPFHISHTATIIVLLIGLALLFSSMMHLQSARLLPSTIPSIPSSITAEGWHRLNQFSQRVSMITKEQVFLRNDAPCISRIPRPLCASLLAGGTAIATETPTPFQILMMLKLSF